jgi:hypothetical protein
MLPILWGFLWIVRNEVILVGVNNATLLHKFLWGYAKNLGNRILSYLALLH